MQKNRWSRKFDWVKNDSTYVQQSRTELYDENRFIAVGDVYFKLNKYLTGVTFNYIISLDDIYNKNNLMTGDGYSIVNMYNEYDVIDRTMKNIISVDIAADTNIDINLQWFQIDDVKLLRRDSTRIKKFAEFVDGQDLSFDKDLLDYLNSNHDCALYCAGKYNLTKIIERHGNSFRVSSNVVAKVVSEKTYKSKLNKIKSA